MHPLFWDCTLGLAARSAPHHIISRLSLGALFQLKPYRNLRFLRFLMFKDEPYTIPIRLVPPECSPSVNFGAFRG